MPRQNSRFAGLHPISQEQNSLLFRRARSLVWDPVFPPALSKVTPLGQITHRGFTQTPQLLTLQLPITHRLKAPWCSESSCSHLVPSMKLSSRLTMNSFSTALHMCLHSMSPGGGRQEEKGVTLSERHVADHQETGRSQKDLTERISKFHLKTKIIGETAFWLQSPDRSASAPLHKETTVSQPFLTFGKANSRSPGIKGWRFYSEIQWL